MVKSHPERGELVVCTVAKAKGFGAFVDLEEYPGIKGFIHIKEVAPGWVKNIRDYVREGQRIVCKVMEVDPSKGYVDLSLKRVNEHQKREKIQQWKNEQKAHKLLEMVGERLGMSYDDCMSQFGNELIEKFGNLYDAFEEAIRKRDDFKEEFKGDWVEKFIEVAEENITIPYVEIKGYLEMSCFGPYGIKHIREALKLVEGEFDETSVTVKYMSAPLYMVKVVSPDYKTAEKILKKQVEKAVEYIKKQGGIANFKREIK